SAKPPVINGMNPTRCNMEPPSSEAGIAGTAMETTRAPASRGENPPAVWNRWVVINSTPATTNIISPAVSTPPVKIRFLKTLASNKGCSSTRCRKINSSRPITPTTVETISSHAERSGFASSLIAITNPTIANMAQTEEMKSQCFSGLVIFGGATANVAIRVTMTTGTLMRNTDPHQKNSKSKPPSSGPAAAPITATDIHTAMAKLRSRTLVNVMRNRARLTGINVAALMPSIPLVVISYQAIGENASAKDPIPKIVTPIRNIRRCPILTPSVPLPSNKPDSTIG